MGGIFGKEKKQSRITEQDQAILVSSRQHLTVQELLITILWYS